MSSPSEPVLTFASMDWASWTPRERATLVIILRGDEILLIHKKRGLGAGKLNGPGGRIEGDETPEACALREVQEEILVTPTGIAQRGELSFQFMDGHSIHGYVFLADGIVGEPQETDEADPMWVSVHAIPYERMWADDRLWLPILLRGGTFRGRFLFDGDTMLGHGIEEMDRYGSFVETAE